MAGFISGFDDQRDEFAIERCADRLNALGVSTCHS